MKFNKNIDRHRYYTKLCTYQNMKEYIESEIAKANKVKAERLRTSRLSRIDYYRRTEFDTFLEEFINKFGVTVEEIEADLKIMDDYV